LLDELRPPHGGDGDRTSFFGAELVKTEILEQSSVVEVSSACFKENKRVYLKELEET